jgi:superfamily II DNA/RNA helicase
VSHVFQPTLPGSCDSYIHRAGRTGRYGRDGKVITIINEEEKFVIERYSNEINTQFQERKLKLVD